MNVIDRSINLLTGLDQYLLALAYEFGIWTYVILFLVVFLFSLAPLFMERMWSRHYGTSAA